MTNREKHILIIAFLILLPLNAAISRFWGSAALSLSKWVGEGAEIAQLIFIVLPLVLYLATDPERIKRKGK
jgi:di/tricarboxylate transporter